MARVSECVIDSIRLAGMRHGVKTKIQGPTPGMFDLRIAQLRVDFDHVASQNFSAALNSVFGFGKERGSATEQHAIIRREPVIMKIVLGIVDHAVSGTEFAR